MTKEQTLHKNAKSLAQMGLNDVAYVRPVLSDELRDQLPEASDIAPGTQLFALHAANGMPILVSDTLEGAVAGAWEKELQTVAVH
jgi:hypothetical protein